MVVRTLVKKDTYFDSVTLMLVTGELKKAAGLENAVVGMGTDYNIDSLKRLRLFSDSLAGVTPSDLIICVEGKDAAQADGALQTAQKLLTERRTKKSSGETFQPSTQEAAGKQMPEANVVVISVPGAHAAREATIALESGRHVMMFSDNVTVEEEIRLKDLAVSHGLLMMGPDCGTAIINNVPLAFANAVRPGEIGLVAASGTGLQEVTSLIHRLGCGITQGIGVGGRDLSEKVAGRMTLLAAKALGGDEKTRVVVLISKPPAPKTLEILLPKLKSLGKPVVIYFIGADPAPIRAMGFTVAETLEDAAIKACELCLGKSIPALMDDSAIRKLAKKAELPGRYLRALYSGGTLCDEAQRLLLPVLDKIHSNTPVKGCEKVPDLYKSTGHTIMDLGDDDFTRGRAHPMIDPSLRQERIGTEAADPDTGMIVFDVVLGFGSNPDMAGEMATAVQKARKESGRKPVFAATICGTESDYQNYQRQRETLESAGILVFPSNVSLVKFISACFEERKG